MNNTITTEIAEFKTVDGITDEHFFDIVNSLEIKYHMKQKGYIDTELIKGKEDKKWLLIQHWRNKEEAKEASKNFVNSSDTLEFRNSLEPKSVSLYFTEQLGKWGSGEAGK